jgi:hypothetical protein
MLKGLNIKLNPIKKCRIRVHQQTRQKWIQNTGTYTKLPAMVGILCCGTENHWEKQTSVFNHLLDESENNQKTYQKGIQHKKIVLFPAVCYRQIPNRPPHGK